MNIYDICKVKKELKPLLRVRPLRFHPYLYKLLQMRKNRSGTYENGTNWVKNVNDDVMHECQYCGTYFLPKRRFIQKFCSESCRVMACKKRKTGMFGTSGGTVYDRNNVTNQALVANINELSMAIRSLSHDLERTKRDINYQSDENTHKISKQLDKQTDRQIKIAGTISKTHENSKWSIIIASIIPFLAPWMRDKVKQAKEDQQKTPADVLDEVMKLTDPIKDEMPEDIKAKFDQIELLKHTLKNYDK
jgi:hypothetical protein